MLSAKRKELGAYYTPPELADYLASWAVVSPNPVILEPSVGEGALISALLKRLDKNLGGKIVGYEIDADTFAAANTRFKSQPVTLYNRDFLETMIGSISPVDAVVANPPFTRNHHLSAQARKQLRSRKEFSGSISGAPGLWAYFLLLSMNFLKLGGRLAFIVPSAVYFARYAKPVLDSLKLQFETVTLLKVDDRVSWGGAAQERASVLLASGFGLGPASGIDQVGFSLLSGQISPVDARPRRLLPISARSLGELARIEIGIVTGANSWFVLNDSQAIANDLSDTVLVPILSRARQLRGLKTTLAEARQMAKMGERTLLFLPDTLGKKGGATRNYLAKIL